jgi:hypothetical protein
VLLYAAYQYRDEELGDRLAASELVLRTWARAGGLRETPV